MQHTGLYFKGEMRYNGIVKKTGAFNAGFTFRTLRGDLSRENDLY